MTKTIREKLYLENDYFNGNEGGLPTVQGIRYRHYELLTRRALDASKIIPKICIHKAFLNIDGIDDFCRKVYLFVSNSSCLSILTHFNA